jgi:hypothetical protein
MMVTITSSNTTKKKNSWSSTVANQNMESAQRVVVLGVILLILLLALVNQRDNAESIMTTLTTAADERSASLLSVFDVTYQEENRPDLRQWEGCTIDSIPSSSTQPDELKAFWVPMFPNSDAGIVGNLIRLLTNSPNGHKNYYASAPGLKKCRGGGSRTISCEQIHPVVGIGPPPERQTDRYQSKILLAMRNPLMAIPAHHHSKAVKYHGATAQVPIDDWREFRDQYFMTSVQDGWRRVLTTWKEMEGYDHEPFYLPYEHLLDVTKGPVLTGQLANVLKTAGYQVVTNTGCVWYQAVHDQLNSSSREQQQQRHPQYDYVDGYIPSLTREQKVALVDELNDIHTTYPTDQALHELLIEYIDQVQREVRTDIPWVNQTASSSTTNGGSGNGQHR